MDYEWMDQLNEQKRQFRIRKGLPPLEKKVREVIKEPEKKEDVPQVVEPPQDVVARKISYEEIERGSTMFGLLSDTQQMAYAEWYRGMVGEKFNLSPEEAHEKTSELIAKTSKALQIKEYVERFRAQGYLEIFSIKLDKKIYLARTPQDKRLLDAPEGDIYLAEEIRQMEGLEGQELMLMLESKDIFNGVLIETPKPKNKLKKGGGFGMTDAEKKKGGG